MRRIALGLLTLSPLVAASSAIVLLLLLPIAARAQSRDALIEAARAFDEGALRANDDNAKPMRVRKWTSPIRLAFRTPGAAPGLVRPTGNAIRAIAAEAGVIVLDVAIGDSPNFAVSFDENESSGQRNCFSQSWSKKGGIYRADLKVNPAYASSIDACIIHEAMHAFGFISHPHAADSVLSYGYRRRALTALDRHLIRTLYDPRLAPNLAAQPASQLACRILGERLAVSGADIEAVCSARKGPAA
jgi:hypothetical protein